MLRQKGCGWKKSPWLEETDVKIGGRSTITGILWAWAEELVL